MVNHTDIEPISININDQILVVMYILVGIIMVISIGQIIYRIINKKRSVIIWIVIGLLTPSLLPNLLNSEIIKIFTNDMLYGDIISQFSAIFLFAGSGAAISIVYNKSVLFLDKN